VVADVDAGVLYRRLLATGHVPAALLADLDRRTPGPGTVKVDWALSSPIPWTSPGTSGAPCLHLLDGMDDVTVAAADLACGRVPRRPPVLFGQMGIADPSRSPAGTETAWAYVHVPNGWRGDAEAVADAIAARVEALAPGFGDSVLGRAVVGPAELEASNPNLVGGDVSGGSVHLHQQLVWRPTPGAARPETPVAGLFLASASIHPGPGVHGACGANAARAALLADRAVGRLAGRLLRRASHRR
jgi:phytoene dehydrogenase-like protein